MKAARAILTGARCFRRRCRRQASTIEARWPAPALRPKRVPGSRWEKSDSVALYRVLRQGRPLPEARAAPKMDRPCLVPNARRPKDRLMNQRGRPHWLCMTDPNADIQASTERILQSSCDEFLADGNMEDRRFVLDRLVAAAREGSDLNHATRNALQMLQAMKLIAKSRRGLRPE